MFPGSSTLIEVMVNVASVELIARLIGYVAIDVGADQKALAW